MKVNDTFDTGMALAEIIALESTCTSKHAVGAVITHYPNRVIGSGCNTVPFGQAQCDSPTLGCNCAPDAEGRCTNAIHAEVNAIAQCARFGVSCDGATMFVTHAPCLACAKLIKVAGITQVVYRVETSSSAIHYLKRVAHISCVEHRRS